MNKFCNTLYKDFSCICWVCVCLSRRIEVHPSGYRETDESFSVYLVGEGFINNEPKAETLLKFKLRVLDQVNRNHVEKTGIMITKRNLLKL